MISWPTPPLGVVRLTFEITTALMAAMARGRRSAGDDGWRGRVVGLVRCRRDRGWWLDDAATMAVSTAFLCNRRRQCCKLAGDGGAPAAAAWQMWLVRAGGGVQARR
ncbi:hypothetical protein PVL29_013343 [Vitis rotundifolia]|uniref:Uncharacterized protein n=1 Tax=Vitis rotundifolia TaxID=103349 RepID=A0AA38ZMM6_VITRO|nr:hypothetical protein PVL29_013343 [Vitis rotundifolia]